MATVGCQWIPGQKIAGGYPYTGTVQPHGLIVDSLYRTPDQPKQLYMLTPVTMVNGSVVPFVQHSGSNCVNAQLIPENLVNTGQLNVSPKIPCAGQPSQQKATLQSQKLPDDKALDVSKYKTRMCRNWIQSQYCPYGNVCMYAHGETELRKVNENAAAMDSLYKLAQQLMTKQGTQALNNPARQGKKKKKSRSKRKKAADAEGEPTEGLEASIHSNTPGQSYEELSDDIVVSDEMMLNMLETLDLNA